MDMPKPTEDHKQLERFVGAWSGDETLYPSPWDPAGSQAIGRLLFRIALDGFALVGDYEQVKDRISVFKGHSVTLWNAADSRYEMHWYDSFGKSPEVFRGTLDGSRLQMTSRNTQGWARMTYEFSNPDRLASRMEMSSDGKTWKAFFDGTYEKVK